MNNKITSIAAALVAKAGTNASAGIGANLTSKQESTTTARKRVTSCTNSFNNLNHQSTDSDQLEATNSCRHQIGTNLSDLSVCWHKMTWPEHCNKCGEPFYKANQFVCEKCDSEDDPVAGTLRNEFFDKSMGKKGGQSSDQAFSNSSTLSSLFSNIAPLCDTQTPETDSEELASVEYLTRKNFEDEFSSMIINSTCGSEVALFSDEFKSIPRHDITKSIAAVPSILTDKDLLGQIKLYNKYNNSIFTELEYDYGQEESLNVSGLLKIHWHLKQPIHLSSDLSTATHESDESFTSNKSAKQTDFKATLINSSDQAKKSCFDDSSINRRQLNARRFSETTNGSGSSHKAHTVQCKPSKWKRPGLDMGVDTNESQKFIPAYASVSSIRINNRVTCLNAIQILLDKYHIVNPASRYSLYKCYQSGETRELGDNDLPLVERIWMGPFSEDKVFIMEKGRQLSTNQEVSNLVSLPQSLLQSLLENLNQEEAKEMSNVRERYLRYRKWLEAGREALDLTRVTKCSM